MKTEGLLQCSQEPAKSMTLHNTLIYDEEFTLTEYEMTNNLGIATLTETIIT